jgi:anti-anti-sigma factor
MPTTLSLDGELTIYRATELCAELKRALSGGTDLELNLAGVTEMDSAGVQLLMAARKTALGAGCALRLTHLSPAVAEVFETLGLAGLFSDPVPAPAGQP